MLINGLSGWQVICDNVREVEESGVTTGICRGEHAAKYELV